MRHCIYALAFLTFSTFSGVASAEDAPDSTQDSGIRIAGQFRLDFLSWLGQSGSPLTGSMGGSDVQFFGLAPVGTIGVRLDKMFIGAGLGLVGGKVCTDDECDNSVEQHGFSFSPVFTYDLIDNEYAALGATGIFNIGIITDRDSCTAGSCSSDADSGSLTWGLTLAATWRGKINSHLALGVEFGWGFLRLGNDGEGSVFAHGFHNGLLVDIAL